MFNLGVANIIPNVSGLILTGNVNFNLNGFSEQIASLASTNATPLVTLSAGQTLTTGNGVSTTYSGTIAGSGNLTKTGAGGMTISGPNTYTGTTTINQGTLTFVQVGPGSNNANIGAGPNTQLTTSAVSVAAGAVANFNTASNFSSSNTGTAPQWCGHDPLVERRLVDGQRGRRHYGVDVTGALIDVLAGTMKNDYASANWGAQSIEFECGRGGLLQFA